MKAIDFHLLTIVTALCLTACTSRASRPGAGHTGAEGGVHTKNLDQESSLCNPHCEQVAYSYKTDPNKVRSLQLRAAEAGSLKAALGSTLISGNPDTVHIHADAINGRLVFLPDSRTDPSRESHLSGNEVSFRSPQATSAAVKVMPTAAAVELMRERETGASSNH